MAREFDLTEECCTADNLSVSTADGEPTARIVTLECQTCGRHESFLYLQKNDFNVCFSYVQYTEARVKSGGKLFKST